MSILNDNNTTRLMQTNEIHTNELTDGIATIKNGQIINLMPPTEPDHLATKEYVDNSGSGSNPGASGPNYSIQVNKGGFLGSEEFIVSDPGGMSSTIIVPEISINGLRISNNRISGLALPVNQTDAANKQYTDSKQNTISFENQNVKTPTFFEMINLVPDQVYNTVLDLTVTPNNDLMFLFPYFVVLPTASEMKTHIEDFSIGKSWTTIVRIIPTYVYEPLAIFIVKNILGDEYTIGTATTVSHDTISITSVVTSIEPPDYYMYVQYSTNIVPETKTIITEHGMKTDSFINGGMFNRAPISFEFNDYDISGVLETETTGVILYPVPANPVIDSSVSITYTYSTLKQFFICRTGLLADTVDSLPDISELILNSDFAMGFGTFRLFIQNPTEYNLTVGLVTGWTLAQGSSNIIPSNHCSVFLITAGPSGHSIRTIGINPLNLEI